MVDREMLEAMSDLLDQKLEEKLDQKLDQKLGPVFERMDKLESDVRYISAVQLESVCDRLDKLESDMKYVRVVQLENGVIPRLNTIEQYYLETSQRYIDKTNQIDRMELYIGALKTTVENHSVRLNQLSV